MMNSEKTTRGHFLMSAAALLAAIVIGFAVIYPASAQVPPSRALFLDLDTVFTQSAVGKSIRVQLEQFLSEIADREKATVAAFEERERTLIVSAQDRPRDELQADWSQLQAERTGQADLYRLERTAVQASSNNARRRVNAVLNEIMQEILVERGANMVLAVTAVHVGGVDYDITAEIIARLDKRLPSLTVERPK